jgi:hypothetical protein
MTSLFPGTELITLHCVSEAARQVLQLASKLETKYTPNALSATFIRHYKCNEYEVTTFHSHCCQCRSLHADKQHFSFYFL